LDDQEKIMINKVNHDLAYALAEFATHVIDRYDSDDPSARTQILVKGVFAGASCGSLVEYAKEKLLLAHTYISPKEIEDIKRRNMDGKNCNLPPRRTK